MIYLVTACQELFTNEIYQIVTVEESLKLLEPLSIVGLDTETEGFDPYTKNLLLLQLGCYDFQVVIDCGTIDVQLYKSYLESDRLFLGWNLKFDLKFLFRQNIVLKRVWDGFLAEKLMWLGYPPGIHSLSLKTAGETYCDIELDKTVRGKIHYAGLAADVIEYSANDVKYLETIMNKQKEELTKKGLLVAIEYENRFVLPLAYCEYCGVKLDIDKWKAKMKKDEERVARALDACNKWIIDYYNKNKSEGKDLYIEEDFIFESDYYVKQEYFRPSGRFEIIGPPHSFTSEDGVTHVARRIRRHFPYVEINLQGDLFTGFNTEPYCTLNWNSAKQLIPLFKMFGVDVTIEDKEKGGTKDSIDAKTLKPQKEKCSLIPIYLEYKEAVKVTSTYGENFLKQVNPVSHRIHTNYSQMGADTTKKHSNICII